MKSLEEHRQEVTNCRKKLGGIRYGYQVIPRHPTYIECPKCGNEMSYVNEYPPVVGYKGDKKTSAKFVVHNHMVNVYCPRCEFTTAVELA
jgi:predicted nucleic-acid-binding Zn-ribbon protein